MTADPWRWQPHPEVWLLVASVVVLGLYAVRVIGPKAVRPGEVIVTRAQKGWFTAAVLVLWVASDWPVHDVAEEYLYSVHMLQHMLLIFAMAPMFLLATPTWLARLVVGNGTAGAAIHRLARPVVAGVVFNAVIVFTHWPEIVNHSVSNGLLHYSLHVLVVASALLMWTPVCGPLPELRISLPAQMVYLFLMSVVPTIPAAWLTFADGVVYKAYDVPYRLWGIRVTQDQQAAGLLMKLGGGMFLWGLITFLFFTWSKRNEEAERRGRLVTERDLLTWDQVQAELERTPPVTPSGR